MASSTEPVSVLKRSLISPPPSSSTTEMSLPLTFLDMVWLHFLPIERLMFYQVPQVSRAHFIDHIIPKLERSLVLTLENFLPLAGHLIIPSGSGPRLPEIRYLRGDSVAVTFSECNKVDHFSYLTADEARNCREFRDLVPELFKLNPPEDDANPGSDIKIPVLAIQVTLFPNSGISIGISNHHSTGDASTIFHFMKTWANLSSHLREEEDRDSVPAKLLENPPFYDRTVIEDSKGLASKFFQRWTDFLENGNTLPIDVHARINVNVRKTFVLSRKDIEKLKNLAVRNGKVKSRAPSGEEAAKEDPEYFICLAECRGRMNPPLPETYFGNCLTLCTTASKYGEIVGEEGFQTAADLIGKTIYEVVKSSDAAVFRKAENWMDGLDDGMKWARHVGVAGSPKYSYYDLDFGWGKPIKFEFASIDLSGAFSLNGSRESDGGIEVGLSLPKLKMDAFTSIFVEMLKSE